MSESTCLVVAFLDRNAHKPQFIESLHMGVVNVDTFDIIDRDNWFPIIDEGDVLSEMKPDDCEDEEVPTTRDDLDPLDVPASAPRGTKLKTADKGTPRKKVPDASPSSPTDSSASESCRTELMVNLVILVVPNEADRMEYCCA